MRLDYMFLYYRIFILLKKDIFFPSKVNQVSATVGKDFTLTSSKLIQFDPGTFCVYSSFHVFVRKSGDCGEGRISRNFSHLETPRGPISPHCKRDLFGLEVLPLAFHYR